MTVSSFDEQFLWRVEEACCNAYPAWREMLLDDWLLRAAGGATRRINSINPRHAGHVDPAYILGAATAIYDRFGRQVVFRVPSLVPSLDRSLAQLGFTADGEVLTLMAAPSFFDNAPEGAVKMLPEHDWLNAWTNCRPDAGASTVAAFRKAIGSLMVPAAFLCRFDGDDAVAVAYVAMHRGVAVLEAVVTHPTHRQRGHARAMVLAAGAWASRVGAEAFCLQVAAENGSARALYANVGFGRELYRYKYRSMPEQG